MAKSKKQLSSYTAKDIYILEGLEPVRKRPGMYIGSTGLDGLHHLIWEIVDNSIDEAMAGYAKHITVELLENNRIRVTDDGRGIPVDIHPKTKKSALETVLCTLHAGGKFGGKSYKVAGGLHGVGVSVVNALSTYLKAEVCRNGLRYQQEYSRGKPTTKVKRVGHCQQTGTIITFEPDPQIFPEIKFDVKKIRDHLRQQAYLTPGITITLLDKREKASFPSYVFHFESGIVAFLKFLTERYSSSLENVFYTRREKEGIIVEIALTYVEDSDSLELTFANNIRTPEGGMHLTGFRSALTRALSDYAHSEKLIKDDKTTLSGDDVRGGLVAIVSVKLKSPQFEGQTKAKLGNPEARTAVEKVMGEDFREYLDGHKEEARKIIARCLLNTRARMAAKKARENILRKGVLQGLTLPGKLADCISQKAEDSELFVVEGDSAGGCLAGDTKIALLDSRNITINQLIKESKQGKRNYCYTIKPDGHVGIALVKNPRKTKINVSVIKVVLDNNETITCTPEHRFMLRDGSYKRADELTSSDSLMPLYRKYSKLGNGITIKGYEMTFDPRSDKWVFTHLLSDRYNLEHNLYYRFPSTVVHHKDFNKLNNNPDNLIRMNKEDHLKLHSRLVEKTLLREDVKEKLRRLRKTKAFREKIRKAMTTPEMKQLLSKRAKKQWQNKEYKEYMLQKFLTFYESNSEYRDKSRRLLYKAQKIYWSNLENRTKQSERVKKYFEEHPERRKWLSQIAQKQWQDSALRNWRAEETKKQWTIEFRKKRRIAYNQTYLRKALDVLHQIYRDNKNIDKESYLLVRKAKRDKNLIRYETICQRFFAGNEEAMKEAAIHYNHRVKKIISLKKKMDVYDIEVPDTHNFALASGIFVHNSAKSGRDRNIQAILPLRGKILNVEKARFDRMMSSQEIKSLIIALGTSIGEDFNINKLRYHKIILATDADVDGAHIQTLLLTLFYRYLRPIIEGGYLYIAQPPLYKIQQGKKVYYAYSDKEKEKILEKLQGESSSIKKPDKVRKLKLTEDNGKEAVLKVESEEAGSASGEEKMKTSKGKSITIQRYKGLGEMNPEQLWETTMDPANRVLRQITIEDAERADKLFDILMGGDVAPRKKFIQAYAQKVKNLDI